MTEDKRQKFSCNDHGADGRPDRGLSALPWTVFVVLAIAGLTLAVLNHAKDKPSSPQAMVAAALRQTGALQEWRPGMGPQPPVANSAALRGHPAWRPLFFCLRHGTTTAPLFGPYGRPHCPLCKQVMRVNK